MILFIGGAWQNKKETALRITGLSPDCVTDGAVCGPDEIFHARIIDHFHMYLLEAMRRGGQAEELADKLCEMNPGVCVICNELGCGVVPLDPEERAWREAVGRACSRLASFSLEVYRVICGIPVRIK